MVKKENNLFIEQLEVETFLEKSKTSPFSFLKMDY